MTKVIADAAKIFDIRLQDHIIVGDAKYYSYCDEGNL
ncbi:MAG: hypothetical protein IKR17_11895 [Bacteroidales bacterium]|nr:hypothetical protein [Bacteroidales bacterium]